MSLFQISDEKMLEEAYDNIRWLQNNRISLQETVSYEQYEDLLDGLVESVKLFEDARDALKNYNATGNASKQNSGVNTYLTNYTAKKNALKAQMEKVKRMRAQGKPAYFSFKGQYDFIKKSKWNSLPEERREINKELRADSKNQGLSFKNYKQNLKDTSGTYLDPLNQVGAMYNPATNTVAINKQTLKNIHDNVDNMADQNDSGKEKLRRHMKLRHGMLAHELTHKAQFDYLSKKFGKDSPEYKRASIRAQSLTPDGKFNTNYYKNPLEYNAYMNGANVKSVRDRSFNTLSDQHKKDLNVMATKNDKDYEDYINKHTDLFNSPGQKKADIISKASGQRMPYLALKQLGFSDKGMDNAIAKIKGQENG